MAYDTKSTPVLGVQLYAYMSDDNVSKVVCIHTLYRSAFKSQASVDRFYIVFTTGTPVEQP
jgi:hypothetical protein